MSDFCQTMQKISNPLQENPKKYCKRLLLEPYKNITMEYVTYFTMKNQIGKEISSRLNENAHSRPTYHLLINFWNTKIIFYKVCTQSSNISIFVISVCSSRSEKNNLTTYIHFPRSEDTDLQLVLCLSVLPLEVTKCLIFHINFSHALSTLVCHKVDFYLVQSFYLKSQVTIVA